MQDALMLRRARIHTQASRELGGRGERPGALGIVSGRIVAVGSESQVAAALPPDTPTVDLGGRTVLPGFTDGHAHWANYALTRRQLRLSPSDSLPEVQRQVREAATGKAPGEWIVGRGWDHSRWDRWPEANDLDGITSEQPVALTRKDGHVVWVNSAALNAAGIGPETPDPPGGEIVRANGSLQGLLKENAIRLVQAAIPEPEAVERQAAMVDSWPDAWSRGIVGCHDMGFMGGGVLFRDLATLRDAGELGLRFVWYFPQSALDEAVGLGLRSGLGDAWVRVGGLKLFLDGTLGSQTAHVLQPYAGTDTTGLPTLSEDEYLDLLRRAEDARLAVAVHAIGDAAVRQALDGFEWARRRYSGRTPARHRVEHAQLVHPDDVPRFEKLDVVASMQPIHAVIDAATAEAYWADRDSLLYPWRSLDDAGARLVFGSDAPVESLDVFAGLAAATTRTPPGRHTGWTPDQTVELDLALAAYTLHPAQAAGVDDQLGSLEPQKRADLIVVSPDPYEAGPEQIGSVRVMATMIDGLWVWQAPDVDLAGPRS